MERKEEEIDLCANQSLLEGIEDDTYKMQLKEEEIGLCANQFLAEDGTHKMEQKEEEISLCANQSLFEWLEDGKYKHKYIDSCCCCLLYKLMKHVMTFNLVSS